MDKLESEDNAGTSRTGNLIDARKHSRFKLDADVKIYPRDSSRVMGRTVDISEQGLAAMLQIEIPLCLLYTSDVYKRQRNMLRTILNTQIAFGGFWSVPMKFLKNFVRALSARIALCISSGAASVSYTHLDVYKRQA